MSSSISLRLISSNIKRGCSSSGRPSSRWGTRNVHKRRGLLYPMEEGVGKFLPPPALKTAVEWQDGLLQRLNEEVKGTPEENTTITQTVINTSTFKEKTLAFNYASLALNNSFFLDQLKPPSPEEENHEKGILSELSLAINDQHGSLRQLKSSVSAAAMGMFTNGWVWFVTDARGVTGIVPTFGPGTLLVRSRLYMAAEKGLNLGDIDPNSSDVLPPSSLTPPSAPTSKPQPPGVAPASPASGLSSPLAPRTPDALGPRFIHTSSPTSFNWGLDGKSSIHGNIEKNTNPGSLPSILNVGEVLYPLFCVSVYEHAWMSAGYGVWGKEEWLKEFWSTVDWAKVSKAYAIAKAARSSIKDGFL